MLISPDATRLCCANTCPVTGSMTSSVRSSTSTATEATPSPSPGPCATTPRRQELWRARCVESRTPGSANGVGNGPGAIPGVGPKFADHQTHHLDVAVESASAEALRDELSCVGDVT